MRVVHRPLRRRARGPHHLRPPPSPLRSCSRSRPLPRRRQSWPPTTTAASPSASRRRIWWTRSIRPRAPWTSWTRWIASSAVGPPPPGRTNRRIDRRLHLPPIPRFHSKCLFLSHSFFLLSLIYIFFEFFRLKNWKKSLRNWNWNIKQAWFGRGINHYH